MLQREDLAKAGGIAALAAALDCGTQDTRFTSMGALAALVAADDRWLLELASSGAALTRTLTAAAAMLTGDHDRSRLEAARLLACVSRLPDVAPRVWGLAGAALIAALMGPCTGCSSSPTAGTPGWAGQRKLQCEAGLAIKALLEPSEWEPEPSRHARRLDVLRAGGLAPLMALAAGNVVVAGSTGGQGSSQELALAAAACFRFVALVPEAAAAAVGEFRRHGGNAVQGLVAGLSSTKFLRERER